MDLMLHLLKYLQRTIQHGIQFSGTTDGKIDYYGDADYGEVSDQKYTWAPSTSYSAH